MAYVTAQRLIARLDTALIAEAIDDDEDKVADSGTLAEILDAASEAVDAMVGSQYTTPFSDPPAAVKHAAFIFACEMIYDRRSQTKGPENNPVFKQAEEQRTYLRAVGRGEVRLSVTSGGGTAALVENTSTLPQRSDFNSL